MFNFTDYIMCDIMYLLNEESAYMRAIIIDDDKIFSSDLSKEFENYFKKLVDTIDVEVISDHFSLELEGLCGLDWVKK